MSEPEKIEEGEVAVSEAEKAAELTAEEKEYKAAIETLYKRHSDYIFQNDARRSLIFVEAVFDLTKKVRIFEDDIGSELPESESSGLWDSIEKHLEDGVLEIVTRDIKSDEVRNKLKKLKEQTDKIVIKKVDNPFLRQVDRVAHEIIKDNFVIPNKHINFTVGDDCSFKLDLPAQPGKVLCSAYNTEISTKLSEAFDRGFPTLSDFAL